MSETREDAFLGGRLTIRQPVRGYRAGADPVFLAAAVAANPPVSHPVIRTHPETGKKVIFVNALFTTHIEELSRSESDALLAFLFEHVTTPEYCLRFSWRRHSIAIWDNRSTQHKPVNDYFPAHRRMERITIH